MNQVINRYYAPREELKDLAIYYRNCIDNSELTQLYSNSTQE